VGLRQALTNGAVADRLACFTPKPGDAVFLPAGTVHALGGDIVVFEIQQNSDVTFRLYDWDHVDAKTGQPRALQVDQALACIDFAQENAGLVAPVVVGKTPVEPLMPPEKATCFCCLRFSGRVRFSIEAQ
jgi:mannose-6-phosphate isomerase